ncbi:hypothetical protein FACS1894137_13200 [Spirochaetia bacterium]|nr:hypothetical protein FACS1894137_13200 [Spirochaetia bacterium]
MRGPGVIIAAQASEGPHVFNGQDPLVIVCIRIRQMGEEMFGRNDENS